LPLAISEADSASFLIAMVKANWEFDVFARPDIDNSGG